MHQSSSDNLEKGNSLLQYRQYSRFIPYYGFLPFWRICKKETVFLHKSSLKHLTTPEERKPNESLFKNNYFQILENNSLVLLYGGRKIDLGP
jgi:N utilization substance protein B